MESSEAAATTAAASFDASLGPLVARGLDGLARTRRLEKEAMMEKEMFPNKMEMMEKKMMGEKVEEDREREGEDDVIGKDEMARKKEKEVLEPKARSSSARESAPRTHRL